MTPASSSWYRSTMAAVVSRSLNGATSMVDSIARGIPAESATGVGNSPGAGGLMLMTA